MMEFEWDAPKAAANLHGHGVSFDEVLRCSSISSQCLVKTPIILSASLDTLLSGSQASGGCSRSHIPIAPAVFASSVHGVSHALKGSSMKKVEGEMRTEYKRSDFGKLERGKFFKEVAKGTSVALIDPKLAKAFPTSEAVNQALRGLLALADETARITGRSKRTVRKRAAV